MIYILILTLIMLGSIANALRGSGKIRKVYVYLVYAIIFTICCWFTNNDLSIYVLGSIGLASFTIDLLCNSFEFGEYYPHGRYDSGEGKSRLEKWLIKNEDKCPKIVIGIVRLLIKVEKLTNKYALWKVMTNILCGKPNPKNKEDVVLWQTTAMAFRFFLTFGLTVPVFLSYFSGELMMLYTAPLFLVCGLLYRIPFLVEETKNSLRYAELLNGAYTSAIRATLLLLI